MCNSCCRPRRQIGKPEGDLEVVACATATAFKQAQDACARTHLQCSHSSCAVGVGRQVEQAPLLWLRQLNTQLHQGTGSSRSTVALAVFFVKRRKSQVCELHEFAVTCMTAATEQTATAVDAFVSNTHPGRKAPQQGQAGRLLLSSRAHPRDCICNSTYMT